MDTPAQDFSDLVFYPAEAAEDAADQAQAPEVAVLARGAKQGAMYVPDAPPVNCMTLEQSQEMAAEAAIAAAETARATVNVVDQLPDWATLPPQVDLMALTEAADAAELASNDLDEILYSGSVVAEALQRSAETLRAVAKVRKQFGLLEPETPAQEPATARKSLRWRLGRRR